MSLSVAAALVVAAALAALLYRRERAGRASREALVAADRVRRERLRAPDWAFYAEHLGRPVPRALRDLYADDELLRVRVHPLEPTALRQLEPIERENLVDGVLPLARTGAGGLLHLRPGPAEPDTVWLTDPGTRETARFAASPDELVARLGAAEARASRGRLVRALDAARGALAEVDTIGVWSRSDGDADDRLRLSRLRDAAMQLRSARDEAGACAARTRGPHPDLDALREGLRELEPAVARLCADPASPGVPDAVREAERLHALARSLPG